MTLELSAYKREVFGKKLRHARKEDKLPAVLYGAKEKNIPLFINSRVFRKVWNDAGETTVVSLSIDDGTKKDVMIHDVAHDPASDMPIHVDFYAIEKGKKITVHVPLVFSGIAPAVKEQGGTLMKVIHEIEVEAEPQNIPHEIEVDISNLVDFDTHITIKDLLLPQGVVAQGEPDEMVASVAAPREEEEEEVPEQDLSSIEVEKKGKKEDDEEGGDKEESQEKPKDKKEEK